MKKMNWKWTLALAAALVGTAVLLDALAWAKPPKPPPPPPPPPAGVTYQIVWVDQVYGAWPEGMNSRGDIVGDSFPYGPDIQTAFLYTEATGAIDLNTLVPPGTGLWLRSGLDINDKGQIVGGARDSNGESHGYRYTPAYEFNGVQYPAVVEDLGKLAPDQRTSPHSINEAGQVCGNSISATGQVYAFYWIKGQGIQPLLPGIASEALSINNLGLIGGMGAPSNVRMAYRTFPGLAPEYFTSPGGSLSFQDMNDNGYFVGGASLVPGSTRPRAYRHDGTSFFDLGAGDGTYARGINNAGDVVGYSPSYVTSKRYWWIRTPGFIYLESKKALYNLDDLVVGTSEDLALWRHGDSNIQPYRINSSGQIAGYLLNLPLGYYPHPRGFLLKPIR